MLPLNMAVVRVTFYGSPRLRDRPGLSYDGLQRPCSTPHSAKLIEITTLGSIWWNQRHIPRRLLAVSICLPNGCLSER
jgi:hypothetical protein